MKCYSVYVTFPNQETAQAIAEELITRKLAACANIINTVTSIYIWESKLQKDQETIMFLKTTKDKLKNLTEKIVELHPYDLPCVVALPIEDGNATYLNWIRDQTRN